MSVFIIAPSLPARRIADLFHAPSIAIDASAPAAIFQSRSCVLPLHFFDEPRRYCVRLRSLLYAIERERWIVLSCGDGRSWSPLLASALFSLDCFAEFETFVASRRPLPSRQHPQVRTIAEALSRAGYSKVLLRTATPSDRLACLRA